MLKRCPRIAVVLSTVLICCAASRAVGGDLWALKPVQDPPVPDVSLQAWPRTPIDRFILARLEAAGLEPSPEADKRTLIRRATYDLLGLPPTQEQVRAFEDDASPTGFEKVVDRLLASPQYGERWGRYWLDLARYSDTKGYVYDREATRFVHAHTYRDWVIRAFNQDLPYDQFLLRQIAADKLPADACANDADDNSDLAAMGFLTVGRRFLGVTYDIIDDRIDAVVRTTQALTVACARCHDHKFDPIPTEDYYSLYGVFAGTSERLMPIHSPLASRSPRFAEYEKGLKEREAKLDAFFNSAKADLCARLRARTSDYLQAVLRADKLHTEIFYTIVAKDDLNPVIVRQWQAYLFQAGKRFDPIFAPWTALAAVPADQFASRAPQLIHEVTADARLNPVVAKAFADAAPTSMSDVAKIYGKLFAEVDQAWATALKAAATQSLPDPNQEALRQVLYAADAPTSIPPGSVSDMEWFFDEETRVKLQQLQAEIEKWDLDPAAPEFALILQDRAVQSNARVFKRGNPADRGAEVPRRYLRAVLGEDRKPFTSGSGRLELARAIADRNNPLTARVMVNRIWLHHFGAGIVRTPSDFGTRADPPSHPELLDWLAMRFMEPAASGHAWSVKALHRMIMLSAVYRQSSDDDAPGRDAARTAADPENRLLFRFNRQRLDFESMRDSLLAATDELDLTLGGAPSDLASTRRSVYALVDRRFLPGVLRAFDFANPDLHIPQRSSTTVPQQALFFLNSAFVMDRARALAHRPDVQRITPPRDRIDKLYRLIYQRPPTSHQVDEAVQFIEAPPAPTPAAPTRTTGAGDWQYGYGAYDAVAQRVTGFKKLPYFTGDAWQGGSNWPDAKLGWARLTAEGGHAGNDLQHAVVRRWAAPRDGAIAISGRVVHEYEAGDGIRALLVCNRGGLLASWTLHNQSADANFSPVPVKQGDTVDFVVDFRNNLNNDMFTWATQIKFVGAGGGEWDARKDFSGAPTDASGPLDPWELYVQVLLCSNEFHFID